MGSGLILLIIVGAWLAVLVPMALRGHDSADSLRSTDRFAGAMRALARRDVRDVLVFRRRTLVVSQTRSSRPPVPGPVADGDFSAGGAGAGGRWAARLLQVLRGSGGLLADRWRPSDRERSAGHPRRRAARRRRRTLLVLLAICVVSLVLGLSLWPVVLAAHALADVALVLLVVRLRRQAVHRRQPSRREAVPHQFETPQVRPLRVAGVPDRMPSRPAPLVVPVSVPAVRYEDRLAATGTDAGWSPTPVPPPLYAGKPAAPARPTRVLDLTQPGKWSDAASGAADRDLDQQELDEGLNRRRVVGGW